jgi:hypothetical protein
VFRDDAAIRVSVVCTQTTAVLANRLIGLIPFSSPKWKYVNRLAIRGMPGLAKAHQGGLFSAPTGKMQALRDSLRTLRIGRVFGNLRFG